MQTNNAIETHNLTKAFKTRRPNPENSGWRFNFKTGVPFVAVNNLNLEIKKGELFGLLGPNGAGKSTLLNMIAGLTNADEGDLYIDGVLVDGRKGEKRVVLNPAERKIGYVFQTISLFPHMRIEDNIAYGLKGIIFQVKKLKTEPAGYLTLLGLLNIQSFILITLAGDRNSEQLSQGHWRQNHRYCCLMSQYQLLTHNLEKTSG